MARRAARHHLGHQGGVSKRKWNEGGGVAGPGASVKARGEFGARPFVVFGSPPMTPH